jgi:murein DD-endopeptidase MepM/ murein hydrolase activator NlpD
MRKVSVRRCGGALGAWAAALALMVSACAPRPDGPAPVISGEASAPTEPERVKVRPGDTLSGIAHDHHLPMRIIAEANHLFPPYRIEAGATLIIPRAGQPAVSPLSVSSAAPPPPTRAEAAASTRIEATALDRLPPAPAEKPSVTAAAPPAATATATEPARPDPKPPAATPAPNAAASPEPPTAAPAAQVHGTGVFQWPVRGHVLVGYGSGRDGTHNDGINIAAPRGAAVEAADAGVVAYTGNELRGYGNLILVKHPNGWISAYAHCDLILVKRGDKVARGQVIARVGSTGNVGEPQLHFELRRGNRAVDPREFLAPLPAAAGELAPGRRWRTRFS